MASRSGRTSGSGVDARMTRSSSNYGCCPTVKWKLALSKERSARNVQTEKQEDSQLSKFLFSLNDVSIMFKCLPINLYNSG